MEISNLSDEFKKLVVRICRELTGYFNSMKKTQKEMKVTLSEINKYLQTSRQDGGIGKHIVPPHTTKRRTTTNLKTKNPRTTRKSNRMEIQQPRS